MALTKAEQDTYIRDVYRLVDRIEALDPLPEPIEGERFVMLDPAAAIRERLRKEAKQERVRSLALEIAVYIGAVSVALPTAIYVAVLYLVK